MTVRPPAPVRPCTIVSLTNQKACRMRWALIQRALGVALVVCLCSGMAQGRAQECGDNPMKQVLLVAKRAGRSLTHVLTLLRDIDGGAYDTLSQKFRLYAACVGLVDTGYFRKRSETSVPMVDAPRLAFSGHHIRVRDIEIANNELPFMEEGDGEVGGVGAATRPPPPPPSHWSWNREALLAPPSRQVRLWMSRARANLTANQKLSSANVRTRLGQEDAEDAILEGSKSLR